MDPLVGGRVEDGEIVDRPLPVRSDVGVRHPIQPHQVLRRQGPRASALGEGQKDGRQTHQTESDRMRGAKGAVSHDVLRNVTSHAV